MKVSLFDRLAAVFPAAVALLFAICFWLPPAAEAQGAQFIGAQSTVISGIQNPFPSDVKVDAAGSIYYLTSTSVVKATPGPGGYTQTTVVSGLYSPSSLAVDKAGNLYIAEQQTSAQTTTGIVFKETLSQGTYVQSTFSTPIVEPLGVAVDAVGGVYVAGAYDSVVKFTPFLGSYLQSTIGSGMNSPRAVTVDAKGNVYVADTQNNRVLKETYSSGTYTQSVIGTGMNFPEGIAVDGAGNVYVSDGNNLRVLELALSGGVYTRSVLPINSDWVDQNQFGGPAGMAVDKYGSLFVTDTGNGQIIKWSPTGADFGQVNVGVKSPVVTLVFKFTTGGTLYNIATLTQGMVQSDFAYSPTGSCSPGSLYFTGVTCDLDVTFTPQMAGDRDGAVLLHNSNLTTFATGYLHGVGLGAQVQYFPGSETSVPYSNSAGSFPTGVAVDGYGAVYIADEQNNRVLKEAPSGTSYIESTVGTGLATPGGVAVDAGGNVYIADTNNNRILKETPSPAGWLQTVIGSGLYGPECVAVGADGSIYISDNLHSRVIKETPSAGGYVQSVIPTTNLVHPYGIAVDAQGNVYVADYTNGDVLKLTLANGIYTQSTFATISGVYGVATDALGNVYLAQFNNSGVLKYTPSGSSYTDVSVPITGLDTPYALAVDAKGNVYVADLGNRQVTRTDFADAPSLTFISTPVNSTSIDSPKAVTMANYGNLPLNLAVPASGENPGVSTNFSLTNDSFQPCPSVDSSANAPGVLTAGQTCTMYVSFAPVAVGTIAGSLVLTDDSLAPTSPGSAHQTISLSGVSTKITTYIDWPVPTAILYGTALDGTQLNATANDGVNLVPGSMVYTPAAGTVLAPGSHQLTVNFTPTNLTDYKKATGHVTLTVKKAILTVTATSASRTYGDTNPAFTYTVTGFVNGDTAATAITGQPALTTTAVAGSPVGKYAIKPTLGTLAATNYVFKFVNGTLTVNKANLTITANDASVPYGQPMPAFTYSPTGFVNGDTSAVLTGTPAETTTATAGSKVGSYPINVAAGTLSAANYSFTFQPGTLSVTYLGTAATPQLSPGTGAYSTAQQVTMTDATAGWMGYYTTDGTTPTINSNKYTGPISVTSSMTIKAIVFAPGYMRSPVASATYTIN